MHDDTYELTLETSEHIIHALHVTGLELFMPELIYRNTDFCVSHFILRIGSAVNYLHLTSHRESHKEREREEGNEREGAPENTAETTFSDAESLITVGSCS